MSKPVCAVIGIGPRNGKAFAQRFSQEGYQVALLSRSTEYSSDLAKELGDARAYRCDVTDPDAISAAFESVTQDLGPVEVLLYNVGSGTFGTFDELDDDAFERAWRINVLGLLQSVRQVAPTMRKVGKGSIVVTGATASLRGKPFTTAFASAKAGQRSLAQSLARQLGPEGVHVALIVVDGRIGLPEGGSNKPELNPNEIAATVYHVATQARSAWTFEVDLRPHNENW